MTDYSKKNDFEINCAVADGLDLQWRQTNPGVIDIPSELQVLVGNKWVLFDPCNSWADAGPIAERNFISLIPVNIGGGENRWRAANYDGNTNICADKNPCRAICIVFLMMNEGV